MKSLDKILRGIGNATVLASALTFGGCYRSNNTPDYNPVPQRIETRQDYKQKSVETDSPEENDSESIDTKLNHSQYKHQNEEKPVTLDEFMDSLDELYIKRNDPNFKLVNWAFGIESENITKEEAVEIVTRNYNEKGREISDNLVNELNERIQEYDPEKLIKEYNYKRGLEYERELHPANIDEKEIERRYRVKIGELEPSQEDLERLEKKRQEQEEKAEKIKRELETKTIEFLKGLNEKLK